MKNPTFAFVSKKKYSKINILIETLLYTIRPKQIYTFHINNLRFNTSLVPFWHQENNPP